MHVCSVVCFCRSCLRIFYSLLMKFFQGIEVDLYFLGKHGENMQKVHLYLQEYVPQTSHT